MSSHSECGYNGCPHCVADGWTTFARKLRTLDGYDKIPQAIRDDVDKIAADKLELTEET